MKYQPLTIEEEIALVHRAKAGDSAAGAALAAHYAPLLTAAANQPHVRTIQEDALSMAGVGFAEAIQQYDPARNIPFAAFAKSKVYAAVLALFRKELRRWQREYLPAGEERPWENVESPEDMETAVAERADLAALMQCLSEEERAILCLIVFEEETQARAAKKIGLSQQTFSRRWKKLREKLRNLIPKFFPRENSLLATCNGKIAVL